MVGFVRIISGGLLLNSCLVATILGYFFLSSSTCLTILSLKDDDFADLITLEQTNLTSRFGCGIKDKDFPMMDLGIAASYITLAAEDEGIGSCILGWFDEKRIKELVSIPQNKRLMLIISLGYTVKAKRRKIRKEFDDIVSFEKYTK